ncbi:MAG TPA: YggS family pyridoxal phosphate-dependent enzyme [Chitinophagaceae bacterium]|nr:YggS family pyridoxal phosphate-dependent enzyme [Chitinophagaceae bacterium]
MPVNKENFAAIVAEAHTKNVTLIAVSKTKPVSDINELYNMGHRDFGENYVQELVDKQKELPQDIRWHFIGHLQSNKVKYIAPFIHLIHGIDSFSLLKEVDKRGKQNNRVIPVLLQMHIAKEETKFGLDEEEITETLKLAKAANLGYVQINGLMGMASNTTEKEVIKNEFQFLKKCFDIHKKDNTTFSVLSMGMSNDYTIALEEDSTAIRIGSLLFGERSNNK